MEDSSDKLEQRAERAVRRGDLLMAVDIFERLLAERPEDERLRQRTESVRSLLQPSELVMRRRPTEPLPEQTSDMKLTDAQSGELLAAAGRYPDAVRAYRRAVEKHPDNELLRDRLAELFRLAPPGSRALDDGLAQAEKLDAFASSEPPPAAGEARSSRAVQAQFRSAPGVPRPSAPPEPVASARRDPADLLRTLLERVRSAARRTA